METKKHFSLLKDYLSFLGLPNPENSMFYIFSFENTKNPLLCKNNDFYISTDFYTISLKNIISGEIFYGRTKYDCSSGTMIFTSPEQELKINNLKVESYGTTLLFHKDFIRQHELKKEINKYNFFSYSINESLHLSEKEITLIKSILKQIELEYFNNQDAFSEEIIIGHISTLLKYANRFYHRQFLHRKKDEIFIEEVFKEELDKYFQEEKILSTPKIKDIADNLNMSTRYLSDKIKIETGKTATELLHLYLIDKAKDLLLKKDKKVSTVAFELGFEYQQHFSKFFKNRVGVSPKEYYLNFKK